MKVEGPKSGGPVGASKKVSKASRGGGASFADALRGPDATDEADGASGAAASGSVNAVDALLALQEVDSAGDALEEKDRRAAKKGEELLDILEQIRDGLLLGTIPQNRLENLSALIAAQREHAHDPRLQSVLDEIDLRAQVELAKFQRGI